MTENDSRLFEMCYMDKKNEKQYKKTIDKYYKIKGLIYDGNR